MGRCFTGLLIPDDCMVGEVLFRTMIAFACQLEAHLAMIPYLVISYVKDNNYYSISVAVSGWGCCASGLHVYW